MVVAVERWGEGGPGGRQVLLSRSRRTVLAEQRHKRTLTRTHTHSFTAAMRPLEAVNESIRR